jgi:hypothetical protein
MFVFEIDGQAKLLGQAFIDFPVKVIDQLGFVQEHLGSRAYAAGAINPINQAFYFMNSMASEFSANEKQIVASLVFQIPYATWAGVAGLGTALTTGGSFGGSVNADFVARIPLEYMVAMLIRKQGTEAVDRLVALLPEGLRPKAVQILKTQDLTATTAQDVEDLATLNTSGQTLADLFVGMFGDEDVNGYTRDPVSRDLLKMLVTDMQFGASGRNFYVQTYGGPMLIDIDLTGEFPPIGEILTFARFRPVAGAILLRQMEALSVVTKVAADGSEEVKLRYSTEDSPIDLPDGSRVSALGLAPVFEMTCHRDPLGASLQ